MKIAVCVKQVPEGPRTRIDPSSNRLDRSGEAALNAYDAHAVEEALRVKGATGDGEVVVVSMGPEKAADALSTAMLVSGRRPDGVLRTYSVGASLIPGLAPGVSKDPEAD